MDNNLFKAEVSVNPIINIGSPNKCMPPVEKVVGSGSGYSKVVKGNVTVKPSQNRTTLELTGPGAMHIEGSLTIGG